MATRAPFWLDSILQDHNPPAKLYAWSPANLYSNYKAEYSRDSELGRRIYVLGVGNLGRLFAHFISQAPDSPPITLVVHRKELLSEWSMGEGIEILRSEVWEKNKKFAIELWSEEAPNRGLVREVANGGKLRNLVVATKAGAALRQVDQLRGYLDRDSTVAFVQNGMSKLWPPHGETYISHRYPVDHAPNFLTCVATHGVTSRGPFKSIHASQASVSVGPVLVNSMSTGATDYLIRQMTTAPHLDATFVSRSDLWIAQLEKLVVNSIINPLTAVLKCKNGALFEEGNEALVPVIDRLLEEASGVLQALVNHDSTAEILGSNHSTRQLTDGSSHEDSELRRQALMTRFSEEKLREMLWIVGHKVKENTSSMLQDVNAGKPTEIRDFNGWIVETASFLNPDLDVSGHQKLIALVEGGAYMKALELKARLIP